MDPFSQELRLREAGVSGATGTDQRHRWHRLDGRLNASTQSTL